MFMMPVIAASVALGSLVGFLFLLLWNLPAHADVAIAPTAQFLGETPLMGPLFVVIIAIETLILWRSWGKTNGYRLSQALLQVSYINLVTGFMGVVWIGFEISEPSWGMDLLLFFPLYFILTVMVEALLLYRFYSPRQSAGLSNYYTASKASLAINLASYTLLIVAFLVLTPHPQRAPNHWVSTRSNMHTLQTMVETYAVDWGGLYPPNIKVLEQASKNGTPSYWHEMTHPENGTPIPLLELNQPAQPYGLRYIPLPDPQIGKYVSYAIYGFGKDGQPVMDKNKPYWLTNS